MYLVYLEFQTQKHTTLDTAYLCHQPQDLCLTELPNLFSSSSHSPSESSESSSLSQRCTSALQPAFCRRSCKCIASWQYTSLSAVLCAMRPCATWRPSGSDRRQTSCADQLTVDRPDQSAAVYLPVYLVCICFRVRNTCICLYLHYYTCVSGI